MCASAPSPETCIGVVLAGGRSRRMGRDKALLDWRGRSLLDHALARFAEAGIAHAVVSGDRPTHAGIPDTHPGEGPLAGLLAVACRHPGRRLLLVPVDMPRLPAAWIEALSRAHAEADALHFAEAPLPLRIQATPDLVARLTGWLDDPGGPRALRHLLREFGAVALPTPAGVDDAFENANTPEDWTRIER